MVAENNIDYRAMSGSSSQQVLMTLDKNLKSYFSATIFLLSSPALIHFPVQRNSCFIVYKAALYKFLDKKQIRSKSLYLLSFTEIICCSTKYMAQI